MAELVVSGCDATELFGLVEEALDQVTRGRVTRGLLSEGGADAHVIETAN
jgi:hypothetical protein